MNPLLCNGWIPVLCLLTVSRHAFVSALSFLSSTYDSYKAAKEFHHSSAWPERNVQKWAIAKDYNKQSHHLLLHCSFIFMQCLFHFQCLNSATEIVVKGEMWDIKACFTTLSFPAFHMCISSTELLACRAFKLVSHLPWLRQVQVQ